MKNSALFCFVFWNTLYGISYRKIIHFHLHSSLCVSSHRVTLVKHCHVLSHWLLGLKSVVIMFKLGYKDIDLEIRRSFYPKQLLNVIFNLCLFVYFILKNHKVLSKIKMFRWENDGHEDDKICEAYKVHVKVKQLNV